MSLPLLDNALWFPSPGTALKHPNGLLALGGDLSPQRLLLAYQSGIFPWFSKNDPIMWWSPNPRGVLYPKDYHCSKSLKKFVDKNEFRVSVNRNFKAVIEHCAKSNRQSQGTWITDEIISAYTELHNLKHAHSVEVWEDEELVGGLYGVSVGAIFCGESMFYLRTDASKLAFYWLIRHFSAMGGELVDCQMQTQHLLSMGAVTVPQSVFLQHLEDYSKKTLKDGAWNTCWLTD